jgi:serine/threonine-protein kinase HipA
MSTEAEVQLWGRTIGAASLEAGDDVVAFEYDPAFAGSGIEIAPIAMPLSRRVYTFQELPRGTFHGLPGLLSDSLPDRFGNVLIDALLDNKRVIGPKQDILEVQNAIEVYRRLGEFDPFSLPSFLEAYRILMQGLVEAPGNCAKVPSGSFVKGTFFTKRLFGKMWRP